MYGNIVVIHNVLKEKITLLNSQSVQYLKKFIILKKKRRQSWEKMKKQNAKPKKSSGKNKKNMGEKQKKKNKQKNKIK